MIVMVIVLVRDGESDWCFGVGTGSPPLGDTVSNCGPPILPSALSLHQNICLLDPTIPPHNPSSFLLRIQRVRYRVPCITGVDLFSGGARFTF